MKSENFHNVTAAKGTCLTPIILDVDARLGQKYGQILTVITPFENFVGLNSKTQKSLLSGTATHNIKYDIFGTIPRSI